MDLRLPTLSCSDRIYLQILNLTKLDVLDDFETIKVAVAYKLNGKELPSFPDNAKDLERIEIVYEELPGWKTTIGGIKKWEDLPDNARKYVEFVEKHIGVPVGWIGTGPERESMIVRV